MNEFTATQTIKAGAAYFALVFGACSVLGSLRVPLLEPGLGDTLAELIEAPYLFVVMVLAAQLCAQHFALPPLVPLRLRVGLLAFGFLLVGEAVLALALRYRTLGDCIASRDRMSGAMLVAMLLLYATMPAIVPEVQRAE